MTGAIHVGAGLSPFFFFGILFIGSQELDRVGGLGMWAPSTFFFFFFPFTLYLAGLK